MKTRFCLLLFILAGKSFGQPIDLWNASFEKEDRQCCITPVDWYDCGSTGDTRSDIQPGSWGVDLPAADGDNYVSLVVRDDGSTEAIGQKLTKPLEKDSFYLLMLSFARSMQLRSSTKSSREPVSFSTPATLKIWGGNDQCDKMQLLAEMGPITNTAWEEIEVLLRPETSITHIFLEACHNIPSLFLYNGNVLIDNLSLTQIP